MDRFSHGLGQPGFGDEYGNERAPYGGEQGGNNPYQQQGGYGGPQGPGEQQSYYNSNDQGRPQYTPAPNSYGQPYDRPAPPPPEYGNYPPRQEYGGGYQEHNQSYPPQQRQEYGQQYSQQPGGEYGQYPPPGGPPGADGDRGVMGALAGGAAGAWGGHKVHHGVLGTIGGAVAGSMLEDAAKKHHQREKEHEHGRPRGFRAMSHDVRLENRCILVAHCENEHGHKHRSEIDLNDCFTNTNGRIFWARGGNFAASTREIRLAHNENVLEAELGDGQGGWIHNQIDLNERITVENGRLIMV